MRKPDKTIKTASNRFFRPAPDVDAALIAEAAATSRSISNTINYRLKIAYGLINAPERDKQASC